MKRAAKFFLIPFLLLIVFKAEAQVRWEEPRVVPEKLYKKNRRVVRFSGITKPNALVRIRKNSLKLFLDSGKSRWAKIPQKNRVQFPLRASENGSFSFDLYLPTVAVEIPVQVKHKGKKWTTSALNFRVPNQGRANDFKAMEDSFRASDNEITRLDKDENYYSRKHDQGQLIRDREGRQGYDSSTVEAWAGLGFSYFDNSTETTNAGAGNVSSSGSAVPVLSFRLGADWKFSENTLVRGAIRSTSGSTDSISGGGAAVTGNDFSWTEAQVGGVFFLNMLKQKKGRLGLDVGLQYHQLPIFREREGFINFTYFDNTVYNLHVGLLYQTQKASKWNYEMYARYLYPISSGDTFSVESSFPLHFELGGGGKMKISRGLAFGVFGQFHYLSMETSYTNNGRNVTADLTYLNLTVDARIIANF